MPAFFKDGKDNIYQVSNVFKPDSQPPIGDDGGVVADVIVVHLFLRLQDELVFKSKSPVEEKTETN